MNSLQILKLSFPARVAGKVQTRRPHPFPAQYSYKLFLALPLWVIVVGNHFTRIYEKSVLT